MKSALIITLLCLVGAPCARAHSPEAQQYFNRLVPYPDPARESILATFIDGLVAAGLWDAFDVLCVRSAVNEGTALTNLKSADLQNVRNYTQGTLSVFTPNVGYSGGTSGSHINTLFNPATAAAPKYTRDSACFGLYSASSPVPQPPAVIATTPESPLSNLQGIFLRPIWNESVVAAINGPNFEAPNPAGGMGLFIVQRSASNACAVYRDNVLLASSTAASTAVLDACIQDFSGFTSRVFFIGRALSATERASLQSLTEALLTGIDSVPAPEDSMALPAGINDLPAPHDTIVTCATGDSTTFADYSYFYQAHGISKDSPLLTKEYYAPRKSFRAFPTSTSIILNYSRSGWRIHDLEAQAAELDALINQNYEATSGRPRRWHILVVRIGTNGESGDPVIAAARVRAYCLARQAAGWHVVICPIWSGNLPNTGFELSDRNYVIPQNKIFATFGPTDGVDRVVSAADARLYGDQAWTNATYFDSDGIHPTEAANAIAAADLNVEISSLVTQLTSHFSYANDGIEDAWQAQYFGVNNSRAAPGMASDGSGLTNLFKYTAGLIPNKSSSKFNLGTQRVAGQPGHCSISFSPTFADRKYTVQFSTDLKTWNTLSGPSAGTGGAVSFTDTNAGGAQKFYRVEITFFSYANDGINDAWQTQYFGANNPRAAPDFVSDGSGLTNLFKYTAGLVPDNSSSKFNLGTQPVAGQPGHRSISYHPTFADRQYTVQFSTDLKTWNTLSGPSAGNGGAVSFTDTNAGGARKFYRLQITKP